MFDVFDILNGYLTCARSTVIEHGRPLLPEVSMRAGKASGHQEVGHHRAVERFRWLIHHEGNRGEKLLILATR